MASCLIQKKNQSGNHGSQEPGWSCAPLTHQSPLLVLLYYSFYSFTIHQLHWPPHYSSSIPGTLPSQAVCTCIFLCLECCPQVDEWLVPLLSSALYPNGIFSMWLSLATPSPFQSFLFPLLCFISVLKTCRNLAYYIFLLISFLLFTSLRKVHKCRDFWLLYFPLLSLVPRICM